MTREKIEAAMAAANTFIDACEEALDQIDLEVARRHEQYPEHADGAPRGSDHSFGSAATGALRRRSMDLTRTLAELRRTR